MNNTQTYIAFIGNSGIGKTTLISAFFTYLTGKTVLADMINNEISCFHNGSKLILTDNLINIKESQDPIIVCLIDYNKQEESKSYCREIIEKEGLSGKHMILFYTHAPYNYEDYFQSKLLGKELSLDYLLERIEDLL